MGLLVNQRANPSVKAPACGRPLTSNVRLPMNRAVSEEAPDETSAGDYAAMVERLNGAAPGKVQEKPRQSHSPGFDATPWFIALLTSFVLGALSYLALSERMITVGGRHGSHLYEGLAAVWVGFALLAGSMLALLQPIRRSQLHFPGAMVLVFAWVAVIVWYFVA